MPNRSMRRHSSIALALVVSPVVLIWATPLVPGGFDIWAPALAALLVGGLLLGIANVVHSFRQPIDVSRWHVAAPLLVVSGYVAFVMSIRWSVQHRYDEARPDIAQVQMADMAKAVELHATKRGRHPQTLQVLTLGPRPIMERIPTDPWEQPYRYHLSEDDFTICSNGEDGVPSTTDDICIEPRPRATRTATVTR